MQAIVREWVRKADGDYDVATREWRARKNRNFDAICFHAQQCIEKYLKAVLQRDKVPFSKTHDLVILTKLCLPKHALWEVDIPNMDQLTRYAVLFRYPGEDAIRDDAQAAMRLMRKYRAMLREELGFEA